jgi:hypothetical protein
VAARANKVNLSKGVDSVCASRDGHQFMRLRWLAAHSVSCCLDSVFTRVHDFQGRLTARSQSSGE